jgi:hypothetical protein
MWAGKRKKLVGLILMVVLELTRWIEDCLVMEVEEGRQRQQQLEALTI